MQKIISSVVLVLLLNGCASMNNEEQATLTGAVVGGLIGSQFGSDSGKVAAAAVGTMAGIYIGGQIGRTMDRQDKLAVERALETAPTGKTVRWKNPDTGQRYSVRPTKTYYRKEQACRDYVTLATIDGKAQRIHGVACRDSGGRWVQVSSPR